MTKRFCDMCGKECKPIKSVFYTRTPNPRQPGFDEKAKFSITISFGLVDHSTRFGGPPDLCASCQKELIEEAIGSKVEP